MMLGLFCLACTKIITITVNPDSSADVQYKIAYDDDKEDKKLTKAEKKELKDSLVFIYTKAFQSSEITKLSYIFTDLYHSRTNFHIAHLDSIARFLDVEFEKDSSIFFITTLPHQIVLDGGIGNDTIKSEPDSTDWKGQIDFPAMIRFELTLYAPEKIKNIRNESGLPIKVSGKKFQIKSDLSKLSHTGKRNRIILEY